MDGNLQKDNFMGYKFIFKLNKSEGELRKIKPEICFKNSKH